MNQNPREIAWLEIKAAIFDVDGTLYDQGRLRRAMLFELLSYYAIRPWGLRDLKIIADFRRVRENEALEITGNLENDQYVLAARSSGVSPERVCRVVKKWIEQAPLKYMARCRFPGLAEFVAALQRRGIATAVFSDYPAREKLAALGLRLDCVVAATDSNVNRLKPDPRGLQVIMETLELTAAQCLFVGDRDDRDGECARRAGMPYLLLGADGFSPSEAYLRLTARLEKGLGRGT